MQKVHIKRYQKETEKLIDAGYQQSVLGGIRIEYKQYIGIENGTQYADQEKQSIDR